MKRKWSILTVAVMAFFVLLFSTNFMGFPPETDQFSKAGKIEYIEDHNTFFNPLYGPKYRDYFFSFYYVFSALIYKLFGGNIFNNMNFQSVILGTIFLSSISYLLCRIHSINPFYTFFVFLSMPIIVTTFSYGNEVAYSLTLFTSSLLSAIISFRFRYLLSAILYCMAIFCRSDLVLTVPFWVAWMSFYSADHEDILGRFKMGTKALAYLIICCFIYWILFLRSFPNISSATFEYETNLKLLAAYLTYPFCLSLAILGLIGYFLVFLKQDKKAWIYLLLLVPALFYINKLTTPKYIIILTLFFGVSAAFMISKLKPTLKVIAISSVLVFWFISISPYGIKILNGYHFIVPTDDGPIPTGAYLSFYDHLRRGFYRAEYRDEIESSQDIVKYLSTQKDDFIVIPYNFQIIHYYIHKSELAKSYDIERYRLNSREFYRSKRVIMARRRYLKSAKMPEEFLEYLKNGQVRSITSNNQILPSFVEIGAWVPKGTNITLGNRILFFHNYYKGYGSLVYSEGFPKMYNTSCWMENHGKTVAPQQGVELYKDEHYTVLSSISKNCKYYGYELPTFYYKNKPPIRGISSIVFISK